MCLQSACVKLCLAYEIKIPGTSCSTCSSRRAKVVNVYEGEYEALPDEAGFNWAMEKLGLGSRKANGSKEQPASETNIDDQIAHARTLKEEEAMRQQAAATRRESEKLEQEKKDKQHQEAMMMQQNVMLQQQRNITELRIQIEHVQQLLLKQSEQIQQAQRHNVPEQQLQPLISNYYRMLQQQQISKSNI